MRDRSLHLKRLLALALLAPLVTGCAGTMSNMMSSDILSRDADWFSRPGRLFIRNIEAPPLSPDQPITQADLVTAEGYCAGMANPTDANALTEGAAGAPAAAPVPTGTVALGHTECDVVRGIGAPASVNLSTGPRGDRQATVTYLQGPRAGIYTFNGGRLSSVERGPEPVAPPKTARSPKPKKRPAAT